jgi:hypothetical protein
MMLCCRLIGVLELYDVPVDSHREREIDDISDIPEVIDWAGPKRARAILDEAIALAKKKDAAA